MTFFFLSTHFKSPDCTSNCCGLTGYGKKGPAVWQDENKKCQFMCWACTSVFLLILEISFASVMIDTKTISKLNPSKLQQNGQYGYVGNGKIDYLKCGFEGVEYSISGTQVEGHTLKSIAIDGLGYDTLTAYVNANSDFTSLQ